MMSGISITIITQSGTFISFFGSGAVHAKMFLGRLTQKKFRTLKATNGQKAERIYYVCTKF